MLIGGAVAAALVGQCRVCAFSSRHHNYKQEFRVAGTNNKVGEYRMCVILIGNAAVKEQLVNEKRFPSYADIRQIPKSATRR